MKWGYITVCILILGIVGGCDWWERLVGPKEEDTTTVFVDLKHSNATTAVNGCGSSDTPCINVTEGLKAAREVSTSETIPTVLIHSGLYDTEPSYPITIDFPVTLRSATELVATIANSDASFGSEEATICIISSGVTIESFNIFGGLSEMTGGNAIEVMANGDATLKKNHIEAYNVISIMEGNAALRENTIKAGNSAISVGQDGSIALIQNEIDGGVFAIAALDSDIILEGNQIQGGLFAVLIAGRTAILRNNEIENCGIGVAVAYGNVELRNNTIGGIVVALGVGLNLGDGIESCATFQKQCAVSLSHNQFKVLPPSEDVSLEMEGSPKAISCQGAYTVNSDGTNRLLTPQYPIECPDLPVMPGYTWF